MKLTVYTTDNGSLRLAKTAEINHTDYYDVLPVADSHGFHPGDVEGDTIRLYPEVKRQQIHGFGGAFTESAAYVFATAPEETKAAILDGYFGKNGIGYNYGRVSIGGCDFSLSAYSYIPDGATDLGSFSVARDEQYTLPFVKPRSPKTPESRCSLRPGRRLRTSKPTKNGRAANSSASTTRCGRATSRRSC